MLESAELYERIQHGAAEYRRERGGRRRRIDYARRRQAPPGQVVDRLAKGLQSLVKKNKVEYIRGTGHAVRAARRSRSSTLGDDGKPDGEIDARRHGRDPRHRQPGQEPARPRAGRQADHHQRRRAQDHARLPKSIDRRRRRRGRRRVRELLPRRRRGGDAPRVPARAHAAGGRRRLEGAGAQLHAGAASRSSPAPASTPRRSPSTRRASA